ncbi:unnamed protein product [Aphanomyces euteiches]|uniref:Uncharacterized protein n=1 Tax=Aphanomyces euteiches TaxID=100861 RepID=A0A6G0WNH3_9STRA|nr:hypothetical protein Ae201684_013352 [Aphanomyces euteiches]KAH9064778.1 hypothetical protein Ae201684P_003560 [Aphanomyces euteiches]KAH9096081.1 hypothetical protein LEN26_017668 [Aphanomyces euteiches]KAH9141937.1 hypothetical protein AeRB84_013931 [Aphanomyces euteiches]
MALAFTDALVSSYGIARVLAGEEDAVMNSVDFHRSGNFCAVSRSDGVVSVINAISGATHKTILTKRFGADLVRYTHHPDCLLWTSQNKAEDHSIRYHSTYDNKFLRYFTGHKKRVTSLMMHPTADEFLSASEDGTFRMWDIRCAEATGLLDCGPSKPALSAAYDSDGLVFGVYTGDNLVRMYDARNFNDGPFAKFSLDEESISSALRPLLQSRQYKGGRVDVHAIQFSPDQQHILLNTSSGVLIQLDAFEGRLTRLFASHSNPSGMKLGAAYSPDGAYIAAGADDGTVCMYNANTGAVTVPAMKGHIGPVFDVQWNPQRHLLASVHANTILWMPPATAT